jgi:hypothetical protein
MLLARSAALAMRALQVPSYAAVVPADVGPLPYAQLAADAVIVKREVGNRRRAARDLDLYLYYMLRRAERLGRKDAHAFLDLLLLNEI